MPETVIQETMQTPINSDENLASPAMEVNRRFSVAPMMDWTERVMQCMVERRFQEIM